MNPWFLAICFVGGVAALFGTTAIRERMRRTYRRTWRNELLDLVGGVAFIVVFFSGGFLAIELTYGDRGAERHYQSSGPSPDPYEMPTQWH